MSRALGRYELLRPLARGGMGEVYLARRRAAGVEKWLVVKRMRPERAGDARFLDLFVREARLSMSLAHQNIVPVFDFGRIDDQVFLAMERVEGKDLGSSLGQTGPHALAPLLAAFIASECCQALDYAHHRRGPDGALLGIVHRDVTPRNVLLSWSGEVKLTDFGIAALAGDESTKMAGTPAYMAPEQARGEPLDARADLYAVGLVLREAVTGFRARPGNDRDSMVVAAQHGRLEPWPEGFDSPLRAIIDRATAHDPAERYADARSMLEALDGFMVTQRAAIKGESPSRQLAAWLADVWKEHRDEPGIEGAIEGQHLYSFLDDGAIDVLGTGTVRSLAATAADAPEPKDAHDSTEQLSSSALISASVRSSPNVVVSSQPAAVSAPGVITAPGLASSPGASRRLITAPGEPGAPVWPWIAGAVALAAVSAGAVAIVMSRPASDARVTDSAGSVVAAAGSGSAIAVPIVSSGSGSAVEPARGSDAIVAVGSGSSAGSGSAAELPHQGSAAPHAGSNPPHRGTEVVIKHHPKSPGAGSGSAAAPPAARYKVTINTKPYWSYWTVDSDPSQHTSPETVELTPGAHRIHFTGNPHFHVDETVTIDVPDHDGLTKVETLKELDPTP